MFRFLTCAVIFCLLGSSCKRKYETIFPTEENISESVYASGIIKSKNQYQVFSTVNGIISNILVKEGDKLKKGDPVFRITNFAAEINTENASLSANYAAMASNTEKLHELQSNIQLAKLKMENEASLLQRQKNLWSQQIGTRNELEQREIALESAKNNYETAKLRYTTLEKQIRFQDEQSRNNLKLSKSISGDYTVKSEVSGKVYRILKEKGEMVNPLNPIALIGDDTAFTLELQVDENDIAKVKKGQLILIQMDSYKGQVFEARLLKINPLMNDRTKSFTVEAAFTRAPPALFPNLTCEANIVVQTKENALTIPRTYLLEGDTVLLYNKEKRKVATGLKDFQKVEITNGITLKDKIRKPV
jgi:RND family efflux transporter MFP subunit